MKLEVIEELCKKTKREINVKNNDFIPKVYYIGLGKTGSASIMTGVQETTVHWHSENYFEDIYKIDLKGNTLYDIALELGEKYKFKPCLVEAIREPIARAVSEVGQNIQRKAIKVKDYKDFIKRIKPSSAIWTYSKNWKDYFGIDIYKEFDNTKPYYYKEVDKAKLLFLKTERSDCWEDAFKEAGYEYIEKRENDSKKRSYSKIYKEVKDNLKYPREELDKIYKNYKIFYTEEEINNFKKKYEDSRNNKSKK